MGERTGIEYVTATWEPISGCSPVSEGCKRCWAERLAKGRLKRFYPDGFGAVRLHPERLDQPWHWRKPRRVFVCSRADLFHEDVPPDFLAQVFQVMQQASHHTFLILSKRVERLSRYRWLMRENAGEWPPNIWAGVSVENQKTAEERIPLLLKTPAAVRWVSCEPLLGPVELRQWLAQPSASGIYVPSYGRGLDWVIVGCESGPGARRMKEDWVRDLRDQAKAAGVPFYYKQQMSVVGKKISLPALDGRQWAEFPDA